MLFSKIFSGIAMAATAMAAATPQQIAGAITSVTQKSQALQPPAQSITILNAIQKFGVLIDGFEDIISTANALILELPDTPPIQAGPDADLVFSAFREVSVTAAHSTLSPFLSRHVISFATLLTTPPFQVRPRPPDPP
ncbi:hypothetical protein F4801DRAFT_549575 [Xylaria longipes]|nr:hypothetical protein F4801DRAFT_549575 [Xylaria longipes]